VCDIMSSSTQLTAEAERALQRRALHDRYDSHPISELITTIAQAPQHTSRRSASHRKMPLLPPHPPPSHPRIPYDLGKKSRIGKVSSHFNSRSNLSPPYVRKSQKSNKCPTNHVITIVLVPRLQSKANGVLKERKGDPDVGV